MLNAEHVRKGWYPTFVDYLHLSVNSAMAFSPTDVSAIKRWAKLTMMAEETISVAVGILVVARAANILAVTPSALIIWPPARRVLGITSACTAGRRSSEQGAGR